MSRSKGLWLVEFALVALASGASADCVSPNAAVSVAATEAPQRGALVPLSVRGPGARFATIEAAAIDALAYAHLQALEAGQRDRMRGGTILRVGRCYSYRAIRIASASNPNRIAYLLERDAVARFHAYPQSSDIVANRGNERLSRADRRSVAFVDPLHRPLYVLHPSLSVRRYAGESPQRLEVTQLRGPQGAPGAWKLTVAAGRRQASCVVGATEPPRENPSVC